MRLYKTYEDLLIEVRPERKLQFFLDIDSVGMYFHDRKTKAFHD